MNILAAIFHRPEPAPVRYVVATRQESRKAQVARIHKELELGIAVSRLSPEERKAAIARAGVRLPLEEAIELQRRAGE